MTMANTTSSSSNLVAFALIGMLLVGTRSDEIHCGFYEHECPEGCYSETPHWRSEKLPNSCLQAGPGYASGHLDDFLVGCGPGQYSATSLAGACRQCPPGSISTGTYNTYCELCPTGFYQDLPGTWYCHPCNDTYWPFPGADEVYIFPNGEAYCDHANRPLTEAPRDGVPRSPSPSPSHNPQDDLVAGPKPPTAAITAMPAVSQENDVTTGANFPTLEPSIMAFPSLSAAPTIDDGEEEADGMGLIPAVLIFHFVFLLVGSSVAYFCSRGYLFSADSYEESDLPIEIGTSSSPNEGAGIHGGQSSLTETRRSMSSSEQCYDSEIIYQGVDEERVKSTEDYYTVEDNALSDEDCEDCEGLDMHYYRSQGMRMEPEHNKEVTDYIVEENAVSDEDCEGFDMPGNIQATKDYTFEDKSVFDEDCDSDEDCEGSGILARCISEGMIAATEDDKETKDNAVRDNADEDNNTFEDTTASEDDCEGFDTILPLGEDLAPQHHSASSNEYVLGPSSLSPPSSWGVRFTR